MHTSLKELLELSMKQDTLSELLQLLFTPGERQEVVRRIEILELLEEGMTQREVAAKVGVGIATVTRGAKELLQCNVKVKELFKK